MIIDSSALLAVLYREPDAALFEQAIATTGEPLLFKGDEFAQTDIASALESEDPQAGCCTRVAITADPSVDASIRTRHSPHKLDNGPLKCDIGEQPESQT